MRSMTLQLGDVGDRVRLRRASGRDRRSARWRPSCIARISTSSSLPRPIRYFGSASGRRCSITSITRTPAVRHSSRSSATRPAEPVRVARRARRPRRRRTSTTTSSARSRSSVAMRRGRDALELLLERLDQRGRRPASLRWNGSVGSSAPRLAALDRRQQVRDVQVGGPPVGPHADRRHQVEPQQRQVDEVVARQRLVAQVRVHQAQAAEPAAAGADAADLGQVDARGVADEHVLDLAAPADQDPDLPLDLARDARTGTPPARPTRPPPGRSRRR